MVLLSVSPTRACTHSPPPLRRRSARTLSSSSGLREKKGPAVLVAARSTAPNLIPTASCCAWVDVNRQAVEVIRRHRDEAVIVYCISRKDTESMAATLRANDIQAAHYHAGMPPEARRKTQEAFAQEKLNVVVATVAFGMGIDRSNVPCVLHTAMPKTVEHYQQGNGARPGGDGLEAEVRAAVHAGGRDAVGEPDPDPSRRECRGHGAQVIAASRHLLHQMQKVCGSAVCRHKELSEYFGQPYEKGNCGACDVCLGEVEGVEGATVMAQKILSCVARTGQRFGAGHVADVLAGADTEMIRRCRHQELSTYGAAEGRSAACKSLMSMV